MVTAQDDALSASTTTPQEATFSAVLDSMFDALVIVRAVRDDAGTIVDFAYDYANAASAERLGYQPGELLGTTMLTIVPEAREVFVRLVDVVETGAPMDLTLAGYAGQRVPGAFEIRARRLDDGAVLTIRTLEPTEGAPTSAAASPDVRQVLEALPVGVAVVGPSGEAGFLNRAGQRLLGGPAPDLERLEDSPERFALERLGSSERYPAAEMGLARALRTGLPASCDDMIVVRGDGSRIPLETNAAPLIGPDGEIAGAVTVFEDVSMRRQQEALLAQALAELTLANEQLGEFASMAAHDLAAPLRAISGFAGLLKDRYGTDLGQDAREWIEFIQTDAARMRTLIDDLLAYARAGAAAPPTSEVDLAAVMAEIEGVLGNAFATKEVELRVESLPLVVGDRAALYVVLRNLLGNALKFARSEGASVVIVSAARDQSEWVVSVADNGVGVPDSERDALFLPFHRGQAAADRAGNGLGLSICRRIVEYHGGRTWYEPTAGGGATFRFTLDAA